MLDGAGAVRRPVRLGSGVSSWKRSARAMAGLPTPRHIITVIANACAAASAKPAPTRCRTTLLLFRALPRCDVKPLAKTLLAKFGSFAEVIAAPEARLAEVKGLGGAGITELKIVQGFASRLLRGAIKKRPVLTLVERARLLPHCARLLR